LQESKNTLDAHKQGRICERLAAKHYTNQGWEIWAHNHKLGGIELDLILFRNFWRIVEIKSVSSWDNLELRLSRRQTQRLTRALYYMQERVSEPVDLKVLYVGPRQCVELPLEEHNI
jgi:Holliday junction resolvase-like predicted endonuclease